MRARDRATQVVYDGDDMHQKAGIGKHPLTWSWRRPRGRGVSHSVLRLITVILAGTLNHFKLEINVNSTQGGAKVAWLSMQTILPLASSNFCLFPYKNSVSAPDRTDCTSVTKVDQIMSFRKIIALNYDNQRNINYTLWGKCVDYLSSNGRYISHHRILQA